MTLSPEGSLVVPAAEEEENKEDGLTVSCSPDLTDPMVVETQHRAVCMTKPYPACHYCKHSTFTLKFQADKERRYDQISCPRWASEVERLKGEPPERYVATEVSTCESKPFPFCVSCPSAKHLQEKYSTDKTKSGWFGRWERFRKEELEDG